MHQRLIDEYDKGKPIFNVSEANRNATYHNVVEPTLADRQREIFEIVIIAGIKGISSKGIQQELEKRKDRPVGLNEFSGRLAEMANPKGYDKRPYCNPPIIEVCGIDPNFNNNNCSQSYTIYRVRSNFL